MGIDELDEDLRKAAGKFLNSLPKDARRELERIIDESACEEDYISAVFVGHCPSCNSIQTKNCEDVEGIDDPTVGLCMYCGHVWCLECGRSLQKNVDCEHWNICEECDAEKDEFDYCGIPAWECEKVMGEETQGGLVCAWCKETIEEDSEVFTLGVKTKKGVDLGDKESGIVNLTLALSGREVPAIVPTADSDAKKEGNDLLFALCCRKCATSLKKELKRERELFEGIMNI